MALPGLPIPKSVADQTTGATLGLETVEIFFSMSPGAPGNTSRGIAGADWTLSMLGFVLDSGTTAADGKIRVTLAPSFPHVLRVLGTDYDLTIRKGKMPAATTALGQQRRLVSLGYGLGEGGPDHDGVDGSLGPKSDLAILDFQCDQGLAMDGVIGPITRGRLEQEAQGLK